MAKVKPAGAAQILWMAGGSGRRGRYDGEELEPRLDSRGLMNRIFGGYARRIDTPWKMYPVCVLFGLGFNTATEVALLVLAGTSMSGARRLAACQGVSDIRFARRAPTERVHGYM